MSRDLERQLDEMGPEYRAVVARLRGARGAEGFPVFRLGSRVFRPVLAAASLLAVVGFGVSFLGRQDFRRETGDTRCAPREYRAGISEMIATQNCDGSWQNDFLTRRNAAALKDCNSPSARIAYKKALRNLRLRGIL